MIEMKNSRKHLRAHIANIVSVFLIFALGFVAAIPRSVQAQPHDALLAAVDAVRAPGPNFGFEVDVTVPDGNKFSMNVLVKDQSKSLVRYIKPVTAEGRTLLFVERNMWVYVPGTQRSLRISPQQQVLGGLASADIARMVFSLDYTLVKVIVQTDGRRLLTLSGVEGAAAYARIDLLIEGKTPNPLSAVFYSASERKVKTAYFEAYSEVLGRQRPTVFRVVDHIDGDRETLMRYLNFVLKQTPDEWFQPAQLKRLQ
jgi:Outer membrane lipoprotein-sorting protein